MQCKSKSVEVTGLRSDISQFPNSDKRNKMVLIDKQKAVIENDFNECSSMVLLNLVNKIKETGSTERRKGSGRTVTATIEGNESIF